MTSRLKRKLDDVEPSSSGNLNESFCQMGTPLPALANTKKDDGEFVPLWKQEVKDDQGRRRLHGAFTGGFSAGYFNSVGSKEGWTPSTFISSRNQRAQPTQRAEDFMDEEDLAEMRSEEKLETKGGFGVENASGSRKRKGPEAALPDFFTSLVQPANTGIGNKLLMRLGWRPGQGVGPRITARALKRQEANSSTSAASPDTKAAHVEGDEDEDEEAKKHLFAPRDTLLRVYEQKEGQEGLGWTKGVGLDQAFGTHAMELDSDAPNEEGKKSGGFGYGIEDVDEDDTDVYGPGPSASILSGRGRFAFHQEEDDDEGDLIRIGSGRTNGFKLGPIRPTHAPPSSTWHDGRPCIPGFIVWSKPIMEDRWFEPPEVPQGWIPKPSRVWNRGKKWDLTPGQKMEEAGGRKGDGIDGEAAWRRRQGITANERGMILGEHKPTQSQAPLPSSQSSAPPESSTSSKPVLKASTKSVFEFMSARDRDRIASLAPPALLPQTTSTSHTHPPAPSSGPLTTRSPAPFVVPTVDPITANSALHGFMPFSGEPLKQARYKTYLLTQSTHSDPTHILDTVPPGETQETLLNELTSFRKAAMIFRPMTGAMANRFTSATSAASGGDTQTTKAGLFVLDPAARAARVEERKREEEAAAEEEKMRKGIGGRIPENETPRQQAARMGMYGNLTRETRAFFPVKLLCKRFGVKDPHPEGPQNADDAGAFMKEGTGVKPIVDPNAWQEKFLHVLGPGTVSTGTSASSSAASSSAASGPITMTEGTPIVTAANAHVDSVTDPDGLAEEPIRYERPSDAIFKAIFASDDEDDEDDLSDDEEVDDKSRLPLAVNPIGSISLAPTVKPAVSRDDGHNDKKEDDEDDDQDLYLPLPPPPRPSALSATLPADAFRPTFSSTKSTLTDEVAAASQQPKKKKAKKDKRPKKALVSFGGDDEEEEEEGEGDVGARGDGGRGGREEERKERREKERKQRLEEKERKRMKKEKEEEEEVWVEKQVIGASHSSSSGGGGGAAGDALVATGKKRASAMDYM